MKNAVSTGLFVIALFATAKDGYPSMWNGLNELFYTCHSAAGVLHGPERNVGALSAAGELLVASLFTGGARCRTVCHPITYLLIGWQSTSIIAYARAHKHSYLLILTNKINERINQKPVKKGYCLYGEDEIQWKGPIWSLTSLLWMHLVL